MFFLSMLPDFYQLSLLNMLMRLIKYYQLNKFDRFERLSFLELKLSFLERTEYSCIIG